jgi:hypothetical protein
MLTSDIPALRPEDTGMKSLLTSMKAARLRFPHNVTMNLEGNPDARHDRERCIVCCTIY